MDKLGLPLSNALKDVAPTSRREEPRASIAPEFVCSGSILKMEFDPKHPVAYGMPKEGFGVQQRAQPHQTFKLLFNSLYYGSIR